MHHWEWHNWGMSIMWLIWTPLLFFFIWILIKQANNQSREINRAENAIDILKKRYANGEISDEEYDQRMKKLKG